MAAIVDQKALEDFIGQADLDEVRHAEAALTTMAASVRLRVVELEIETRSVLATGRHHET